MAMLGSINGVLMAGLDGDNTWRLRTTSPGAATSS